MKIWCLLLSIVSAVLSGVLVFIIQSGQYPVQAVREAASFSEPNTVVSDRPLISSRMGLVDELVESLQAAHEELDAARLRLDKREKNLQELYATYLKLRKETDRLMGDLENQLIKVEKIEVKNFKKLSGVYSKMDPAAAAQSLKHMDAERVALILSQMDSRSMAAIMDEAVSISVDGSEHVAQWSDAMRRLDEGKDDA
ncbi:hypothetical protein EGM51_08200 [Verrucomicrobia bacterium S94]|nr:hypothetical protein EGM51_08200 [Verrucomicrobia bacterium S94]